VNQPNGVDNPFGAPAGAETIEGFESVPELVCSLTVPCVVA